MLRGTVAGRDQVAFIVKAGGSLYHRQTPTLLGMVEHHAIENATGGKVLLSFRS